MLLERAALAVVLVAAACASESSGVVITNLARPDSIDASNYSGSAVPLVPLTSLAVPTYDSSGQSVHPDVQYFPGGWHGWQYWMAYTPYPGANAAFENPSLVVSHDGASWEVPSGVTNPLVPPTVVHDYNSDPDLTYDAARDRLVLLYRQVASGYNVVYSRMSGDGVHWSPPRELFRRPNHGIVSPTLVFAPGDLPTVWYVDAGPWQCPERRTRVMVQQAAAASALSPRVAARGWTEPQQTDLVQPGYAIWHIDVTWVAERQEYWAVYPAYRAETCEGDDLFFARSSDGVHWLTYPIPFLARRKGEWTGGSLYRTTTLYDANRDVIRFFTSAEDDSVVWHLGFVEYRLPEFLAWLQHGAPDPREDAAPSARRGSVTSRRIDEP